MYLDCLWFKYYVDCTSKIIDGPPGVVQNSVGKGGSGTPTEERN